MGSGSAAAEDLAPMEKRIFLAILLSMLVLVGFYTWFPPPSPPPPADPPASTAPPGKLDTANPLTPSEQGASLVTADENAPPAPGQRIEVRTPLYTAGFHSRGGVLERFVLEQYREHKKSLFWGDLLPGVFGAPPPSERDPQQHVRLVEPGPGKPFFGVRIVGEERLSETLRRANYTLQRSESQPLQLAIESPAGLPLSVRKTITFQENTYLMRARFTVRNTSTEPLNVQLEVLFGDGPAEEVVYRGFGNHVGPIWFAEGDTDTEDADDISAELRVEDPQWLAVTDSYFISAARPETPIDHAFYTTREQPGAQNAVWIASYGMRTHTTQLAPNETTQLETTLYLGPKRSSDMAAFGTTLERSRDLMLDIIASPMLAMLGWFYSFTGNYGWAIILLTILVRSILFPLTYTGMVTMKRMQKMQPRVSALREKFKKDRQRQQQEIMQLYRRQRINPLGGCLPILLQIPIFFALYSALLGAVELRHAPFMLWISDLSVRDGLYVLPLAMGATMFVQQWITPSTADPLQRKIMLWMPLIFLIFVFNFPAGLVLYWCTSNLLSIAQQVIINRVHIAEPKD